MSSRTLKGNRFSLIALFKFSAPALIAVNYLSHKLEEAIDDEDDNAFF